MVRGNRGSWLLPRIACSGVWYPIDQGKKQYKKECDGILARLQGEPGKVYCLYMIISPISKTDPPDRID